MKRIYIFAKLLGFFLSIHFLQRAGNSLHYDVNTCVINPKLVFLYDIHVFLVLEFIPASSQNKLMNL